MTNINNLMKLEGRVKVLLNGSVQYSITGIYEDGFRMNWGDLKSDVGVRRQLTIHAKRNGLTKIGPYLAERK
jgi:hypothetical protein